jgi:hypothetical protein
METTADVTGGKLIATKVLKLTLVAFHKIHGETAGNPFAILHSVSSAKVYYKHSNTNK